MSETTLQNIRKTLEQLRAEGCYRQLSKSPETLSGQGLQKIVNFSSNDYLGLAEDQELVKAFFETVPSGKLRMGASSSRLMMGNFESHEVLEALLAGLYGTESALVFNSGYHLNIGILPAVCGKKSLILADRLVHASIIDGIRLSGSTFIRYPHNDYPALRKLVVQHNNDYESIIIVTESIFSMDGDEADLQELVRIKKAFPNVMLYVDEAHAVGVRGIKGLGCAEEKGCKQEIDFLAGTFGKAVASMGAFVVCRREIRDFLVNKMRSLIYSTALPPVNVEWTTFIMQRLPELLQKRERLASLGTMLRAGLQRKGYACPSTSHIIPVMIGDVFTTLEKAEALRQQGFHVLAVRPPTVPAGTSRLRLSLSTLHQQEQIEKLIEIL